MRHSFRKTVSAAVFAFVACAVSSYPVLAAEALKGRVPDDTYFPDQWHLAKIRAPEAWQYSLGFEGVTIAIIDSGVDINHPDLKDNIWRNLKEIPGNGYDDDGNGYVDDVNGWDFVDNDNDPRPDLRNGYSVIGANHGTVDAGIAAAKGGNGKGIAGVAWQASIMPLRALDSTGIGEPSSIVRAVEYAVHNGAKIINLSFAGPARTPELAIALRRAYDAGVFIVAATGNAPDGGPAVDLDKNPLYPVCLDSDSDENFIYGVAAVDDQDRLASFSNYGAGCADISAPGSRMISTQLRVPGNKDFEQPYGGFYNGTSLAAAEVSGVVALIRALDYNLTPKQIMNIITESAVNVDAANKGYFGKLGRGRVDAAAAVEKTLALLKRDTSPVLATSSLLPSGSDGRVIITAPGKGRSSDVRMFTTDGTFIRSFLAFPESFKGGVSLALANFDGNSRKTIVAGAMAGGSPHVRIFDINSRPLGAFLAYDPAFTGGVSVATADLDGDGRDEIITGAGPGGGPHVRIFAPNGRSIGGFFAFDKTSRAGVDVSVADLDGDGRAEIIAVQPNGTVMRVYDGKGQMLFSDALPGKSVGVSVTDADGDDKPDIVVRFAVAKGVPAMAAYNRLGGRVADFDADGKSLTSTAVKKPTLHNMLFGAPATQPPTVTLIDARGVVFRFSAYATTFRGGVTAIITK